MFLKIHALLSLRHQETGTDVEVAACLHKVSTPAIARGVSLQAGKSSSRRYHATCSAGIHSCAITTDDSELLEVRNCQLARLSSLQRCSCWSQPLALHGNVWSELGEPRNLLQIFYILHMFITSIVTSFLHYAELIVKNYMFHSTLLYRSQGNETRRGGSSGGYSKLAGRDMARQSVPIQI